MEKVHLILVLEDGALYQKTISLPSRNRDNTPLLQRPSL